METEPGSVTPNTGSYEVQSAAEPTAGSHEQGARSVTDILAQLRANITRVFLGRPQVVEHVLTALLAAGHLLIEDAPGLGKTTLARTLARSIDCSFKRIQFTPDLLPSDVLGMSVYRPDHSDLIWKPGPIFAHVVLADEINRTNPRTQSALLEAMADAQVSSDGVTRPLPRPFLVIATQNPFEFEGTYPLPESQLDRFLLCIDIGYPAPGEEKAVLHAQRLGHPLDSLCAVVNFEEVLMLQGATREVHVAEEVLDYLLAVVQGTRGHADLAIGVSPRGSLAMRRAAQARALLCGRDYVSPDDIKALAAPVFKHRLVLRRRWENGSGHAGGDRAGAILGEVLERCAAPR